MTEARIHKTVAGVVTQPTFTPSAKVEKSVSVVVVQPLAIFPAALLEKAVSAVVTQQDASGNATQPTNANRPTYRAGPKPYVEFSAGKSLTVNLLFAGDYTLLTLLTDGAHTVQNLTLAAGLYTLPSVNFNQAILVRGTLSRIAVASLALSMRDRAGY